MELHGWRRGHSKNASAGRRICLVALISCILLLIAVAALRSFIGDSLAASPALTINLPTWAATGWNAQAVDGWIHVAPHKSTFLETLFSLPLLVGWWIRHHQIWGLPALFCGTVILLGLWRLAAHVLRMRKPSVFFPALIVLQCAALGWGWTFYAPSPYRLNTELSVINLESTFASILSPAQQVSWHQQNGYTGFAFYESKDNSYKTQFPKMLFIDPAIAQSYNARFPVNIDWWVFPQNTFSESQLKTNWKNGKVAAISLENPLDNAWQHLPAASLINVFLSLLAVLLIAVSWGMQPPSAPLSAPGRIINFLQKSRRLKRWGGMLMMISTFIGTLLALWLTFYPAWGFVRLETLSLQTTALLCIALDYCYWLGRKSWKKKH